MPVIELDSEFVLIDDKFENLNRPLFSFCLESFSKSHSELHDPNLNRNCDESKMIFGVSGSQLSTIFNAEGTEIQYDFIEHALSTLKPILKGKLARSMYIRDSNLGLEPSLKEKKPFLNLKKTSVKLIKIRSF